MTEDPQRAHRGQQPAADLAASAFMKRPGPLTNAHPPPDLNKADVRQSSPSTRRRSGAASTDAPPSAFESSPAPLPFLSPITDILAKNPLQPYQATYDKLSVKFRSLVISLIRKASQVDDGGTCSALALELNPLDVRDAEVHLLRAPSHRPTPSGYRTAFSVAYLQILANLNHHNVQAGGLVSDPVPHLQAFFKPPTTTVNDTLERKLPDGSRLLSTCTRHLPNPARVSLEHFDPRRAIVWICIPGKTLDTVPQFYCIAGWARWSALLAVLEGIRYKCSPQSIPETYKRALETTVPVYVLDGSDLTTVDLMALSLGLNLADCGNKRLSTADVLESFTTAPVLTEVKSRPCSLADRLWTMHHALVHAILRTPEKGTRKPLVHEVNMLLQSFDRLEPTYSWLVTEAQGLHASVWITNPLVFPNGPPDSIDDLVEMLIGFLLYIGWPLQHEQVMTMNLEDFRSVCGATFPFCDFEIRGKKCGGVGFMDELLLHHIPYQVQTVFTLADMFGLVRVFETFFVPRNSKLNKVISQLPWTTSEHVSLINHYSKDDSANAFVSRIVANEPLKSMSAQAHPWCFESLSAFICVYNLHYILELIESPTGPVMVKPEAATQVPAELTGFRPAGPARTLHLVRAMLITAYLTYDNPAQLLDLAKSQIGEAALATPLEFPSGCRPDVSVITSTVFSTLPSDFKMSEVGRSLEESFELTLGALSEFVFRELSGGLGRDEIYPSPWSPTIPFDGTAPNAQKMMSLRSQSHEVAYTRNYVLLEALKGGSLIVQLFLRQCHLASKGLAINHSTALFGVPNTEANNKLRGDLNPATFVNIPIPDVLTARQRVYESVVRSFARGGTDVASLSHYNFVWRFMEPLEKKGLPKAAALAEAVLINNFQKPQPQPEVKNRSPGSKQAAPNRYPDGVVPSEPAEGASPTPSSLEELQGRTKVETQEAFNRACAQKLMALQQQQQTQKHSEPEKREVKGSSAPDHTVAKATARTQPFSTSVDTQERITHWFEERKSEAKSLLSHLGRIVQNGTTPNSTAFVCADFRGMLPDEAKDRSAPLSDLASESTNLVSSLQEMPYQIQIEDASVLPFSAKALQLVCSEIEPVLQAHLADGLQQLVSVRELGHSVVASARPAVICALWQTLVQMSPFLDVLHPLALNWQRTRALFCSWLWSELRKKLQKFWQDMCKEKLEGSIPTLRWSLRCLPADQDTHFLATLPDLTTERLQNLLRAPRMLDRICSAFYRFQCSGMANAKAALGGSSVPPSVQNLNEVFFTSEMSLRDVFVSLWATLPADAVVEDVLHEPDIAAAGFLKRYAPYVLSGLEQRDKQMDLEETAEPHAKRRRREATRDNQDIVEEAFSRRVRRKEEVHPAVVANTASILALKRELRNMGRHGRRMAKPGYKMDADMDEGENELQDEETEDLQQKGEEASQSGPGPGASCSDGWLRMLPLSLRLRLEQTLPSSDIYDEFQTRLSYNLNHHRPPPVGTSHGGESSDTTTLTAPAPVTDRSQSRSFRKRRKGKAAAPTSESAANGKKPIEQENDAAWNGAFPILPPWLETTPAWTLWQAITKRADSASFTTKPQISEWDEFSHGGLSMAHTLQESEEISEMSEPEWQLVETVLDCLTRRGISALYSSSANRMFMLNVHGVGNPMSFAEAAKDLDDQGDHPSSNDERLQRATFSNEPRPATKGLLPRRGGLRNLRHFLNGFVIPERSLVTEASPWAVGARPTVLEMASPSPRIRNGPTSVRTREGGDQEGLCFPLSDVPEDVYLLVDQIYK